jgi:hypothetical protein
VVVDVTALSRMVRSCAAPAAEAEAEAEAEADGDGESSSTVETGNGSEAAADPDDVGSSNKRRHRCGRNNAAQQRSAGDLLRRYGTARSAPRRWFFPHTALPRRESDSGEFPRLLFKVPGLRIPHPEALISMAMPTRGGLCPAAARKKTIREIDRRAADHRSVTGSIANGEQITRKCR